jgi:hypothetical protein
MTTMPITAIQGPPSVSAPRQAGRRRAAPPPVAPTGSAPTGTAPTGTASGNPSERLDPGLGLIVLSLHDAAGQVTDSIPTARQLQAYRVWQEARVGATQGPTPPTLPDGVPFSGADSPPVPVPVPVPAPVPLPAASSPGLPLPPAAAAAEPVPTSRTSRFG